MDPRDNASAARSCLFILVIGAALVLIACVITLLGVAPVDILPEPTPRAEDQRGTVTSGESLTMAVLDVGQGAAVLIITPDGRTLLADSGRSGSRVEEAILPYLDERNIDRIDYLVATNPDQDHIGGMPTLLESIEVGAWVDPVVPSTNQAYARSLEMVEQIGVTPIEARRGDEIDLGERVTVDILWPADPLLMDGSEVSRNDNSIVLRITYGDVSFLIPGDIEENAEQALVEMETNEELKSDVLVIPHHGSRTSSTADFLDVVDPEVAIIPVGVDNQYGHPHDEVIQRLTFRDIDIYRTDIDGTVEVTTDGDNYRIERLGK